MANSIIETLAAEVREQNELYDRGEVDRAFWLGQRHRLDRMKETDRSLTQVTLGELVGKSNNWVSRLLMWDSSARELPDWDSGSNKRDEIVAKALRNPQRRREAIAALEPEIRDEIREEIWQAEATEAAADPDFQRARRKLTDRNHQDDAHKALGKAYWALRGRLEFYGDVPLDDHERDLVPVLRFLIEKIEAGVQMDDELRALLAEHGEVEQ